MVHFYDHKMLYKKLVFHPENYNCCVLKNHKILIQLQKVTRSIYRQENIN